MKAIFLLLVLVCTVLAQQRNQLLFTGVFNSSSQVQFSFQGVADPSYLQETLTINEVNVVIFGLSASTFHSAPTRTDKKQDFGFVLKPESVSFDANGNLQINGVAKATYELLNSLYPVPCARDQDCHHGKARETSVSFSLSFSSSVGGGVLGDFQRIVRAGNTGVISTLPDWSFDYTASGSPSRSERSLGFIDYTLTNPVSGRFNKLNPSVGINNLALPALWLWKDLKLQPVGINVQVKNCINFPVGCTCCTSYYSPDPSPTGPAGLNFGRPQADLQWRKSSITFTWLPMVNITNNTSFKILDTTAEEETFRNSYDDPTAIEIFFSRQFSPASKYGGYQTTYSGAVSDIIATEYGSDCTKVTRLAHALGHIMNLDDAPSDTVSTGTIMCPHFNYCPNNMKNSYENQIHASNPLFTHYLLAVAPPADDCQYSADCGYCPMPPIG